MPPATVTTWPVTWPDRTGEARATTWPATSSGWATLRSAIVLEILRIASGSTCPRVIGDSVQPGATTFTRAFGARRTTSFFSERRSPCATADFAAAVVYLTSDVLSGHVTGQVLTVAGGMEGRTVHQD